MAATSGRRIRPCSAARWAGASSRLSAISTREEPAMLRFRAMSALLSYPSEEMRKALPEIADVIRASLLVAERERRGLLGLINELGSDDLLEVEQRYVDLFDRG